LDSHYAYAGALAAEALPGHRSFIEIGSMRHAANALLPQDIPVRLLRLS
jgi:hypothetical protein